MTRVRPICINQSETNVDALTDGEVEQICLRVIWMMESNLIWNKHGLAILLSAATGMRQGEILVLKKEDIIIDDVEKYAMIRVDEAYAQIDGIKTTKEEEQDTPFVTSVLL